MVGRFTDEFLGDIQTQFDRKRCSSSCDAILVLDDGFRFNFCVEQKSEIVAWIIVMGTEVPLEIRKVIRGTKSGDRITKSHEVKPGTAFIYDKCNVQLVRI